MWVLFCVYTVLCAWALQCSTLLPPVSAFVFQNGPSSIQCGRKARSLDRLVAGAVVCGVTRSLTCKLEILQVPQSYCCVYGDMDVYGDMECLC